MQGRIPGVGLEKWGGVIQCLEGALSYYFDLAMFGNLEVFFVLLSLLTHCFVILIKYSRAQKRTQASYPHYHPFLLL